MFRFRVCLLVLTAGAIPPAWSAADPADLTPAQAQSEIRLLERALVALHPGLYRYRTPSQIDAEFAAAEAAVSQGASIGTMYLLASRLSAAVRCGHTWTNPLNQSGAVARSVLGAADKLPLRLRVVAGRLLVTASADPQVQAGDELIAVDGRAAPDLIAELLPYLRADGSNDGKRLSQLDSGVNGGAMDRLFPLLHPPANGRYALRIRKLAAGETPRTVAVAASTVAWREDTLAAGGQSVASEAWRLQFAAPMAILTMPTFAFWRGNFDWRRFLDDAFTEIGRRGITGLVLDLRRDEGGDNAVGDALLAHLLRTPYAPPASRAEVRFERVPYALAHFLDTWDFDFFDHTGQVQALGGRNLRLLTANEGGMPIMPAAPHYAGRTVALVGPQMSSAGFLIGRDLQRSHAAILVGQELGGNLGGMNGGQLAWLNLPKSGVAVDNPLVAWTPTTPQPDATVVPDVPVPQDFDAAAHGTDWEMGAAMAVLADDARWLAH